MKKKSLADFNPPGSAANYDAHVMAVEKCSESGRLIWSTYFRSEA